MTTAPGFSRVQENLEKLEELKRRNPSIEFIYIRRTGSDGATIDIPISHAEMTIRNHPLWEVVASEKQMDDEVENLFKDSEDESSDDTVAAVIHPENQKRLDEMNNENEPTEPVIPPKPSEVNKVMRKKRGTAPKKKSPVRRRKKRNA